MTERERVRLRNWLISYLMKGGAAAEDAGDAATSALLSIESRYDPARGRLTTFLSQSAYGHLRDLWRKEKRYRKRLVPVQEFEFEVENSWTAPGDAYADVDTALSLEAWMQRLTPVQQRVVGLLASGASQREAADELGVSRTAINNTLRRIRLAWLRDFR